jgi:hypothetical protein
MGKKPFLLLRKFWCGLQIQQKFSAFALCIKGCLEWRAFFNHHPHYPHFQGWAENLNALHSRHSSVLRNGYIFSFPPLFHGKASFHREKRH